MIYHHLTTQERSQIYALKSNGITQKTIAEHLQVSPSTISREIKRNSVSGEYRFQAADQRAQERKSMANRKPKKWDSILEVQIEYLLQEQVSPQQISGLLKTKGIYISHERIYQYIWQDKKAGGTLYTHLRHRQKKYRKRDSKKTAGRGFIPNRVDISERPKIVDNKARFGDWEADLIVGKNHKGAILTLVERKTKISLCFLLKDQRSETVVQALRKRVGKLPKNFTFKTITFDNGKEFSLHSKISEETNAKCYFAKPYCSWQRGLNEHTNGLVRQYLPKGTDFLKLTDEEVQNIEDTLNNRPRKILNYLTPWGALLKLTKNVVVNLYQGLSEVNDALAQWTSQRSWHSI